ncbi:MAG: MBOAT family protein [Caenispirillum bisanense]|nr:MBOAT family protein [Caenispirillum bisanense]MCA1974358.1 MBOAT family protein [Caenispirillum sp.]
MLFNSYEFLFLFLPVVAAGYAVLSRWGQGRGVVAWLVLASLFFYGWWNPVYLVLLGGSMVVNYGLGRAIAGRRGAGRDRAAKALLIAGIAANLGALGYFKYAGLLVQTVNDAAGTGFSLGAIVLPLAISFFTFQQIAYLADCWANGDDGGYGPLRYALFVSFFPQLIAGPIVHHREMMPQFARPAGLTAENVAVGVTVLAIGLFKKAVLADGIAPYATGTFRAAEQGAALDLLQAWGGALAYSFQIYFDFSGYSDMAIGAALIFGITLPLNFASPYKATSIIEFWRRWHMTLSRFLRDYLYIPLGGSRKGTAWRYGNLMITMLLGGLWHGAGWTFLVWGGLHGFYLMVAHLWRAVAGERRPLRGIGGWMLTMLAVVVAWVFFRAESFAGAWTLLGGMAGLNGVALPNAIAARLGEAWTLLSGWGVGSYLGGGSDFVLMWTWIAVLLPIVVACPNTQEIVARLRQGTERASRLQWQPSGRWAVATGVAAGVGVLTLTGVSEFLYFQF